MQNNIVVGLKMVKLTVRQVPEGVLLLGAVLAGGRRDAGFLTPTVTKIWRAAQGEVGPVSQQHEELSDEVSRGSQGIKMTSIRPPTTDPLDNSYLTTGFLTTRT